MSGASAATTTERVYLDGDDEIRGQKFVCLSFLTPEKALMRTKDAYLVSKFLDFFALDYKVKASESFLFAELRTIQDTLSGVEMSLANSLTDVSGLDVAASGLAPLRAHLAELEKQVQKVREDLARRVPADLETYVKTNLSDFKESKIQEAWDTYMMANRTKLEDEFHKSNGFKTTMYGLKVRGTYPTQEQAATRARTLSKKDPHHNVYVGEVGEWMPWDPAPEEVDDQEYPLDQLNTLMKSYKDNVAKKDAFFEEEKRQKMAEAASAAAVAKGAAAKPAVFGVKGNEIGAVDVARDLFDGAASVDLAIARKAEAAAASSVSGGAATGDSTILHM
jgi:hypothetical protein